MSKNETTEHTPTFDIDVEAVEKEDFNLRGEYLKLALKEDIDMYLWGKEGNVSLDERLLVLQIKALETEFNKYERILYDAIRDFKKSAQSIEYCLPYVRVQLAAIKELREQLKEAAKEGDNVND